MNSFEKKIFSEVSLTAETVFTGRLPLRTRYHRTRDARKSVERESAGCQRETKARGKETRSEKDRTSGRSDRTRYHSQVYIKTVVCRENNPG